MKQYTILDKLETKYNETIKLTDATAVYKEMSDIKDANKEIFVVFCLNTKNKIISREIVTIGILDASLVHPREVFRKAILTNSKSIILAHNHPSGDPEPSNEDIKITKTLVEAGNILDIKVLDHVIIVRNGYTSLMMKGHIT